MYQSYHIRLYTLIILSSVLIANVHLAFMNCMECPETTSIQIHYVLRKRVFFCYISFKKKCIEQKSRSLNTLSTLMNLISFFFLHRNTMHLQSTFACVKKEATPPALNISDSLTTISIASSGNSRIRCFLHSVTWKS